MIYESAIPARAPCSCWRVLSFSCRFCLEGPRRSESEKICFRMGVGTEKTAETCGKDSRMDYLSAQNMSFAYEANGERGKIRSAPRRFPWHQKRGIRGAAGPQRFRQIHAGKAFQRHAPAERRKGLCGRTRHHGRRRSKLRFAAAWALFSRTRTTSLSQASWKKTSPSGRKTSALLRRKSAAGSTRRSKPWRCTTTASTHRTSFPAGRSSALPSRASSPWSRTASCSTSRPPCSTRAGATRCSRPFTN